MITKFGPYFKNVQVQIQIKRYDKLDKRQERKPMLQAMDRLKWRRSHHMKRDNEMKIEWNMKLYYRN